MDSQITEFSFGFALTRELVNINPAGLLAAPTFPSLIEEGNPGGGYDVSLNFGIFIFLQFKLTQYMVRGTAGQSGVIAPPYYRFWLMPTWRSQQHALLVDLEGSGQEVYYAAPAFWTQAAFNAAFAADEVASQSRLISPSAMGLLLDAENHCVVFNEDATFFLSEPKRIPFLRGNELAEHISSRARGGVPGSISDVHQVAATMDGIVRKHGFTTTGLASLQGKKALQYIAFLAHAFFHSEMIFLPSSPIQLQTD